MPTVSPRPVTPNADPRRGGAEEGAFVDSADMFVEAAAAAWAQKDETKEAAVKQKRVWVRVTRLCNQRCTFCLDSWNQNGTYVPRGELEAFVRRGRQQGGQRLILSGGEASVHPDFLRLIRYGREQGYEWIQTVTNGQLFAYPEFALKAKVAGLNEATFSMHGHTPKLHDALVGLPGAFERANQGIRNLQALGGVVVNVDIVINKQNARHLRNILDFYLEMGIREFDLLFIVPFGRGFEEYREQLFFNPREYFDAFQSAFEVSKQPGVFVWTNRFPVAHLEGYEHLIQDPHKLHSEVNGGRHNFDGYLQTGTKPDCFGERCDHCFLSGLCRTEMFSYREALLTNGFERVAADVSSPAASPQADTVFAAQRTRDVEARGGSVAQRLAWLGQPRFEGAERRALWIESPEELDEWAAHPHLAAANALMLRGIHTALKCQERGDCGLDTTIELTQSVAAMILRGELDELLPHTWLRLPNHEYLSQSRAADPSAEQLRALAEAGWRLENVAPCLGGQREGRHRELDLAMLDSKGRLDTDAYVSRYVVGEYYAKSLRCESCPLTTTCRGMHINWLRNVGFAALKPIAPSGAERPPLPGS